MLAYPGHSSGALELAAANQEVRLTKSSTASLNTSYNIFSELQAFW